MALCGQNLSAFSTAIFQHPASVFGAHTLPKAVYIFTAPVAWLKCALHMFTPVSSQAKTHRINARFQPKGQPNPSNHCLETGSSSFPPKGSPKERHHRDDSLNHYSCGTENMSRKGGESPLLWITDFISRVVHWLSTGYPPVIHRIHTCG